MFSALAEQYDRFNRMGVARSVPTATIIKLSVAAFGAMTKQDSAAHSEADDRIRQAREMDSLSGIRS